MATLSSWRGSANKSWGRNPSSKEQEEHRQTLKWLLRLTRLIHSMAADPEFPEPSAAELLEVKLWQLEQSWKMIYEPMPKEEANRILAEVFPDESWAGENPESLR